MKCHNCNKEIVKPIKASPSRHLLSPSTFLDDKGKKSLQDYCSQECCDETQRARYEFWSELDRNASDSECFEHDHWDGKCRVGKCKITGDEVRVEPLQPGENSGQPIACYEHFTLRTRI